MTASAVAIGNIQGGAARTVEAAATTLGKGARAAWSGVTLTAEQAANLARNMSKQGMRVAGGSGGVVMAAAAVFFQSWAINESWGDIKTKLGPQASEAELALGTAGIGALGAVVELVGQGIKITGSLAANSARIATGSAWITAGAYISAVACAVQAVQSGFSAYRTFKTGDSDAGKRYVLAGVAFAGAAYFSVIAAGASAGAVLGPVGIAIGLIAAEIILTWMALDAEDSQAEVWLDRCYFGIGERSEGKWSDSDVAEELAELNAILVGLSGTLGFSDAWLYLEEHVTGYERLDYEVKLGGYANGAAYEWVLYALNSDDSTDYPAASGRAGSIPLVTRGGDESEKHKIKDRWFREPSQSVGTDKDSGGALVIRGSVEVLAKKFQSARLEARYWPDPQDRSAMAQIIIRDND